MMQIVYYSQKEQLLAEIQGNDSGLVFITPSPLKADNLRIQLAADSGQDVITISKFTGDLLTTLYPIEENRPILKRKSELLLIFGILKNKYFPELGYEQFNQAYNLFSDLRSFSLNLEALGPVLDEQSDDVKKAVQLFWMLLDAMKFVDEHGAYHHLSEELRTHEEVDELKKTFVFWGFQHLNGQQIDLIKSLAIRYKVIIPFPGSLKNALKRSDWMSWLLDHKVEEKILPDAEKLPRAQWMAVNSREMSRYLKLYATAGSQVLLGVSKLSAHHIDIIPHTEVNFKVPHTLLQSELNEVAFELKQSKTENLALWLLEQNKKILLLGQEMSFKKIKVLQLYEEALNSIAELTDEAPTADLFFQKLLKEVVSLNQPRTSFVPSLEKGATLDLRDMATLEDVDRKRPVIMCVDERFDDFQGLGQTYTESIQKTLASLGPIKRNELELLFKQWEMIDLFSKADILLLMPESVLKHSLVWKKVFSSIQLEKIPHNSGVVPREPVDYFKSLTKKSFSGNFSASKFQTFYDCPRKFYFNYIEKLSPAITLERDIDNKISGTLVHRIIELYFERGLSEDGIFLLAKEVLDHEVQTSHLTLPADVYSERLIIFAHRAANGINVLKVMEEKTSQKITWKIEEKFEYQDHYTIKGSVDCLGVSDTHLYLLDFKSTKSSASSNTEIENLESLQLWVYALAAEKKIPDFSKKSIVLGYVVLDEPKKSNIFFEDEDLHKTMKEANFCSPTTWDGDFREILVGARMKLETLALSIAEEKIFPPRPRSGDACTYCELAAVCTKEELSDV